MSFVFSFHSTVLKVEEKSMMLDGKQVSIGWFVQLYEFAESVKVGDNQPDLKKGDRIMITWRKET